MVYIMLKRDGTKQNEDVGSWCDAGCQTADIMIKCTVFSGPTATI